MNRTQARAAAMKLVYEFDMGGEGGEETKLNLLEIQPQEEESDYMDTLVEGVKANLQKIDAVINRYAKGWTTERMPKVDLAILRVAVYELLWKITPADISINEAIELSHAYCDDKAAAFINGVLGNIHREEA